MSGKSSGIADIISVPQGGGAVKGLGEKFAPDLHTGTGNFSVPIALPPGRNGLQPQLTLGFSTGNGNGVFGFGWSLSVPGVSRLTSKGIPRYRDDSDIFVLSGAEDLVEVERTSNAEGGLLVSSYRPRTEGLFAKITRHTDNSNHWEVRSKDGLISIYGTPGTTPNAIGSDNRAVIANPGNRSQVFAWRLTETRDPFGNRIVYEYERDNVTDHGHNGDQLYLKRIRYVDVEVPDHAEFLVSVELLYDADAPGLTSDGGRRPRVDVHSDFRAGFEIRTRRRCTGIVVRTHPSVAADVLVRAYEFIYLDEQTTDSRELPKNAASLLSRINVIGYDDDGQPHRELPPLDFSYTQFTPEARRFQALKGAALPTTSLANPDVELIDVLGNGLPDILELGDFPRYWRNLGDGQFDRPRPLEDVPAGLRLSNNGVQLIDANGDGRADLLVTEEAMSGYYPMDFRAGFSKKSFQRYRQAPSFNLEDPQVRLVDLTGDGVTDVLRSGSSFECFFNDRKDGWLPSNTARVSRQRLEAFPDVDFADPRVKLADLTGDGLQDIAVAYQGRLDYWPNIGYGRWARRITTQIPGGLPFDFDPKRLLLSDVDGDGLADLVYVSDRSVTLWINRSGNGWSDPITVHGTPAITDADTIRITDLHGTGVGGLLWTRDTDGSVHPSHFFLDLTGGIKPYLLDRMDNNLGAITEVHYASSTKFYLRDQTKAGTRWRSTLPFPVQVVERVAVTDAFSGGTHTTEYRYHHGYWDGVEREFRGFGMVEQLDTEVFDAYTGRDLGTAPAALQRLLSQKSYAPPMLTRTWFHQGPVTPDGDGRWQDMDYHLEFWTGDKNLLDGVPTANPALRWQRDAQRALRGSILRSEVYALDGSPLQEKPYTVTEQAYDLREESTPSEGATRQRIYFPHSVAQRTTQWERGSDPMTQFSFTSGFDEFGQPSRQLAIACPRGWKGIGDASAKPYLATLAHTTYARPDTTGAYIQDRVCRSRSFELLNTPSKTVDQLRIIDESSPDLKLFGESLTYYDGPAHTGLPQGQIGRYGIPVRAESLVMTSEHLTEAYGTAIPPYLVNGGNPAASGEYPQAFLDKLPPLAGYLFKPASGVNSEGFYAVTASKRFDFHDPTSKARGLLQAQRDPLGHEAVIVEYDAFGLLPTRVRDPAGFETTARYHLRTLQPKEVTDANGNVIRVVYSPTGLVTETWALGKPDAPASDRANAGDRNEASVKMEYNLRAFHESRLNDPANPQPVYARAIRRVFHDSDPADTGETIEAHEYSDGFGRLLQTRTQGERERFGDPHFGGGNDVLPIDQDGPSNAPIIGVEETDPASPNVVVSGWQRYDNKGQVVKKFEPFYADGWHYQPVTDAQKGRAVQMYYDPRGQVVLTVNPDGSEQRVIHGVPINLDDPPLSPLETAKFTPTPWEAYTYDANDNAGRTHAGIEPHTLYAHHYNTPASIEVDALGRTVRAVARHREAPQTGNPTIMPAIEEHITRSVYDIQGNVTGIRDALGRLAFEYVYDFAKHPLRNESIDAGRKTVLLNAAGSPVENRDAKGALALHAYDELNRPTHLWARDSALDPMTLREELSYDGDPAQPTETLTANFRGKLWRNRDEAGEVIVSLYDFKGQVLQSRRQVLSDEFMLGNYKAHVDGTPWNLQAPRVDWDNPPTNLLDSRIYETRSAYDALGRVQWSNYPEAANGERYRLKPKYNRAGALQSVELMGPLDASSQGPTQPFVQRIAYNAKGQRTLIAYGNGILTRYAYEPDTFRLARLRSERYSIDGGSPLVYRPRGLPLQDIAYWYDLAGNILGMKDVTPGCGVANNADAIFYEGDLRQRLSAGDSLIRCFEYDPLYRLTSATGREANNIASPRPWADLPRDGYNSGNHGTPNQDNAPNLTSLYWEEYDYDAAGNMLTLRHNRRVAGGNGGGWQTAWSRRFGMEGHTPGQWRPEARQHLTGDWDNPPSNRLTHVEDRAAGISSSPSVSQSHFYDANGNMIGEHNERRFEWDYADRLKVFRNQIDTSKPTTYALYLYDSSGIRVKKLVVNGGNGYRTTTYLGNAFEHHTQLELNGSGKAENCSLHVMDDKSRIAIVRVGPAFEDDGAKDHPFQYHLGDHLSNSGLVISGNGDWMNREEYFPFGETSFGSFSNKRYRFTGKSMDEETGATYHGFRYYYPHLCRWQNSDNKKLNPLETSFEYCGNSPIQNIDHDGADWLNSIKEFFGINRADEAINKALTSDDGDIAAAYRQKYLGMAGAGSLLSTTGEAVMMAIPGPGGVEADTETVVAQAAKNKSLRNATEVDLVKAEEQQVRVAVSDGLTKKGNVRGKFMEVIDPVVQKVKRIFNNDARLLEELRALRTGALEQLSGAGKGGKTLAILQVGEKKFSGWSFVGARELEDVNPITLSHAEGDVFDQAVREGAQSRDAVLVIDHPGGLCAHCARDDGVIEAARQLGVENLKIVTPDYSYEIQILPRSVP